jgi:drug/metabolite transporter (DMT)-like permease
VTAPAAQLSGTNGETVSPGRHADGNGAGSLTTLADPAHGTVSPGRHADGNGAGSLTTLADPAHGKVDLRSGLYVVLMVIIGSTTAGAASIAVRELPIAWLPVVRFGVAGLCLLPLVWRSPAVWNVARQDPVLLFLSAAFCVPINQAFFLTAAKLGPTSHVGIFYATCPLVVLLAAWAMRLERPDLGRLWGVLVSVAGIAVIAVGNLWDGRGDSPAEVRNVMIADFLLVGAVLSWGGYLTVSKPLVARHGAMPTLVGTLLLGCLLSLPIAIVMGPSVWTLGPVSWSSWVAVAVLSLLITPLGWAFQNLSMRRFDASQVATFSNGSPVLTVVWGVWLFGERLTPSLLIGSAVALAGIYWASRPRRAPGAMRALERRMSIRELVSPAERQAVAPALVLSEEGRS